MSIRTSYLLGFIIICMLLLASAYLQFFDNFIPCPLCTLQRLAFALLGILFFMGILIHRMRFARIFINLCLTVTSFIGIFLAGRQIWMQHIPNPKMAECGVSLQYMLQVLPLNEVMSKILTEGSTECTKRTWEFLHLSMAEWALVWFVLLLCLTIALFLKEFRRNNRH